jgi:S-adenosylmethionine decarboxylase
MPREVEHKALAPHIFSLRFWIKQTEPEILKSVFDNQLSETDFKVLNFSEFFFPVQGYTAIWLLAESHLAIHTFPLHEWTYVELSGCNESKTETFKEMIENKSFELIWETNQPSQSFPSEAKRETKLNLQK